MRAKKNINFLFCVHITFLFFILSAFHSPCLSPLCLSISSFFLHRPFSPSLISQVQPPQNLFSIVDLTSPAATDPSVSLCTHSISIEKDQATLLAAKSGGSVRARFVGEDLETVPLSAGLVGRYRNGQCIGHGFRFGCVDFSGFLFCSSSLVLMGTTRLWLCSDFYWFDGGCGCVLVVE